MIFVRIFVMIFFPIELGPRSSCRRMCSGAAEAFAPTSVKPSVPPPQTIVVVAASSAGIKPKSTVGLGSRSKVGGQTKEHQVDAVIL